MLIGSSELIIKKSKFIGLLYEIKTEDEAKDILDDLKKEHPKARHIPYAYVLENTARKSDDKEPHNTAGIQLFNLLNINNLNSHLLVVIRYFGGTKLGAGNLLRAYLNAGKMAIESQKN